MAKHVSAILCRSNGHYLANINNTGCAGSRIYVQEGIYDKFVAKLKEHIAKNVVGDPFDEKTFQGPQVSQLQFDRIMGYLVHTVNGEVNQLILSLSYIQHGKQEGANLELGGCRIGDKGFFIQPTIFTDVKPDMKIMREEVGWSKCDSVFVLTTL